MEVKINSVSTKDDLAEISIGNSIELKTSNFSGEIDDDPKTWEFNAWGFGQIEKMLHRAHSAFNFQEYAVERDDSFEITNFTVNKRSTSCKFVNEESTIDIAFLNRGSGDVLQRGKENLNSILKEAIETMKESQKNCMSTSTRTSRPPYGF